MGIGNGRPMNAAGRAASPGSPVHDTIPVLMDPYPASLLWSLALESGLGRNLPGLAQATLADEIAARPFNRKTGPLPNWT
jgi:hypothetical protein